ncbi:heptaprenyl diphosphate synthase component i [Lucifera butyrica]|uniref:Heptaprenyl diphosphate synthase component i n=1 Tax=Lucifera butyrica TaxID=1351585 RepID=A0A498RFI7_9FIRM|nr:Gx transporter family protein [Lucifera butyrica]VBB07858.1 heptaprenyl diphosphate synthase component i [Lucifera butyrica]
MKSTKRMIVLAFLLTMAIMLHVVESWLPLPLPVPGIKLGLANFISLFVIVAYGWRETLSVALLRVLLGSLLNGTFLGLTFAMSLSAALISTTAMVLTYRFLYPTFSLVGVSVIGAVFHNLTQILVACVVISSAGLLWYLPYLILFAVPTGVITGLTARHFMTRIPKWS